MADDFAPPNAELMTPDRALEIAENWPEYAEPPSPVFVGRVLAAELRRVQQMRCGSCHRWDKCDGAAGGWCPFFEDMLQEDFGCLAWEGNNGD